MNKNDKKNMYRLFREHDDAVGSSKATAISLESLSQSLMELKCPKGKIRPSIVDLCDAIKMSEPRIVPLIRIINEFESEMEEHYGKELEEIREKATLILKEKVKNYNYKVAMVTEHGQAYIENNDTVMVHTASTGVIGMLVRAKTEQNKKFRVLVLKQDLLKTKQLISALDGAGIDHIVVPEYDLSHIVETCNKLIMGGLAVTTDGKIVTAVGSANIVSLCHLSRVPIYLFINTMKFSVLPSSDQRIHKKKAIVSKADHSYQLTTYSHDLVDLKLINHMITEKGEMDTSHHFKSLSGL